MAETFNPDKVLLSQKKDGTFIDAHEVEILKGLRDTSAVIELGKYVEMDGQAKNFSFITGSGGAYWVGEGEKIKSEKGELVEATLVSKKLAKNIVVSREYLNFTWSDFFEEYKDSIIESFQQTIDEAVIKGINNPFAQSIESAVTKNGKVVEGDINFTNVLSAFDHVYDAKTKPNAVVSTLPNRSALRNAVDATGNAVFNAIDETLDGVRVEDVDSVEKGELYVGNFDYVYYGIPRGIEFHILTEGQITDIKGSDGQPINLGERQLIALQPTLHFGALIVKDDAFAKVTPAE